MAMKTLECDILVLGAGMAGSCIARQLKLQNPDLKVVNIDRRTSFSYWIGESTVEAWEDYMVRCLGLGDFLKGTFIEKHGLRMFWDSPEKNLSIREMSEFGRTAYHGVTARHLDRAVFDQRMCELNRELGIDVRLGVSVPPRDACEIDRENGHVIQTSQGPIHCRWLIDASGRTSPLAVKYDLVPRTVHHRSASYWARFRGVHKLDALADDEMRQRVNGTVRYRSTNHFLYKGYWFWHIALSDDVVSIGIEFNRDQHNIPIESKKDLVDFMLSHRCLAEVLGDNYEVLDFIGFAELPRGARQSFSTDRWYLAGMSGFFADVMGSGTSRVYSEINRLIGELIRTDRSGDRQKLERQTAFFNAYARATFSSFRQYLSNYNWYGSYDLFSNFFGVGLAIYFNTNLPNCKTDLMSVIKDAEMMGGMSSEELDALFVKKLDSGTRSATHRLGAEFFEFLERTGSYYDANRGQFSDSLFWEDRPDISEKLERPRDSELEKMADQKTYEFYFRRLLTRMCEVSKIPFNEERFRAHFQPAWDSRQTLGQLLEAMRGA